MPEDSENLSTPSLPEQPQPTAQVTRRRFLAGLGAVAGSVLGVFGSNKPAEAPMSQESQPLVHSKSPEAEKFMQDFKASFHAKEGDKNFNPEMDLNSDGFVDMTDFSIKASELSEEKNKS